jgi:hypothetical protein
LSDEERLVDQSFGEAEAKVKEEYERILGQLRKRLEDIKRRYVERLSKI